jgi:hypothetical protein
MSDTPTSEALLLAEKVREHAKVLAWEMTTPNIGAMQRDSDALAAHVIAREAVVEEFDAFLDKVIASDRVTKRRLLEG